MSYFIDTHFHTSYSDGRLDNEDIIKKPNGNRGFLVATDHDIVNSDFCNLAQKNGFESCEGVEISILDEKCGYIHVAAYAKKFAGEILDILENTRNGRRSRLYKQIKVLQNNGIYIDEDSFFSFFEEKGINIFNLNVYHLASYIYRFEYNVNLIEKLTGIKMDKIEFLKRCLRNEGDFAHIGSAYVEEYTPDTEIIIKAIQENDGVGAVVHPNFTFSPDEHDDRVNYLQEVGFNAVEINSKATNEQVGKILKILKKGNTLTFGSDCHFTPYSEADHGDFTIMNPNIDFKIMEKNIKTFIEKLNT